MMQMTKWRFVMAMAAATAAPVGAVELIGLTSGNKLVRFDTATGRQGVFKPIGGLSVGERLVGIDLRPSDGFIYAVSTFNRVYRLEETAPSNRVRFAATVVGQLPLQLVDPLNACRYGIDFDPVADAAGRPSLRLMNEVSGRNFLVDVNGGSAFDMDDDVPLGFSYLAHPPAVNGTITL